MRKLIQNKRRAITFLIILVCIALAAILAFRDKTDYSELDTFDFSLAFGPYGNSIINTYDNTLTNAFYDDKNYVHYEIPKRVKKQIYKLMMQLEISECETSLNYGVHDFEHPQYYSLKVNIGDEMKRIAWHLPWNLEGEDIAKFSDEQNRFLSFANYIISYVTGTKEYKNLPKPTKSYL